MANLARGEARIHYEVEGEGPPFLLLPDMGVDSLSWSSLAGDLARQYQVICLDLRGVGRTRTAEPFRVEDLAEDARAVLARIGGDPARVLGHGLGGMVALQLALDHPLQVERLVVLGTAPRVSARNLALFRDWVRLRASGVDPAQYVRLVLPWIFAPGLFETPDMVDAAVQATLDYPFRPTVDQFRAQVEAMAACDLRDRLGILSQPTLVLSGAEDLLVPPSLGAALAMQLPRATHKVLPGGHAAHLDAPDAFLAALQGFC